jgi:hypothetical protein
VIGGQGPGPGAVIWAMSRGQGPGSGARGRRVKIFEDQDLDCATEMVSWEFCCFAVGSGLRSRSRSRLRSSSIKFLLQDQVIVH